MAFSYFTVPSGQPFRRPLPGHVVARLAQPLRRTRSVEEAANRRSQALWRRSEKAGEVYRAARKIAMSRHLFDFHDRAVAKHRAERAQQEAERRRTTLLQCKSDAIAAGYNEWYDARVCKEEEEHLSKSKRDRYGGKRAGLWEEHLILSNASIRVSSVGPARALSAPYRPASN